MAHTRESIRITTPRMMHDDGHTIQRATASYTCHDTQETKHEAATGPLLVSKATGASAKDHHEDPARATPTTARLPAKVNQARSDRQTRDPAPAQTKSVQVIRGQASPGDDQGLKRREREKILTSPRSLTISKNGPRAQMHEALLPTA